MSGNRTRQGWRAVTATLVDAFRSVGTAKTLARMADVSTSTAARWQRGETEPTGSMLVRLIAKSDHVRSAVLKSAGLHELCLYDEEVRLTQRLERLRARRQGIDATDHS